MDEQEKTDIIVEIKKIQKDFQVTFKKKVFKYILALILLASITVYLMFAVYITQERNNIEKEKYISIIKDESLCIAIEEQVRNLTSWVKEIRRQESKLNNIKVSENDIEIIASQLLIGHIYRSIPYEEVMALIAGESFWNPKAKSIKDAKGLMQLMDETKHEMCLFLDEVPKKSYLIRLNMKCGIKYIQHIKFILKNGTRYRDGLGRLATPKEWVMAYNGGQTRFLREQWWKNPKMVCDESKELYEKWKFYYKHYKKKQYNVWYYNKDKRYKRRSGK